MRTLDLRKQFKALSQPSAKAPELVDVPGHHEVYLGNPRRSVPEELKTVVRHPIRRVGRA